MKHQSYLFAMFLLLFNCCSGPDEDAKSDSVDVVKSDPVDTARQRYKLEFLLDFNSENELVQAYGKNHVIYDTIWGAEGFFTMGTILKTENVSRIEITWKNDAKKTEIVSATLVSDQNWFGDSIQPGMWHSNTGIKLGMSLEEVEKINGRPFSFSGFGWDYAGGLMSWEGGTLEGKGISIQMSEGTGYDSLPEDEYTKILGDVPVMSNNATARKSGARVWSVSVAKVE